MRRHAIHTTAAHRSSSPLLTPLLALAVLAGGAAPAMAGSCTLELFNGAFSQYQVRGQTPDPITFTPYPPPSQVMFEMTFRHQDFRDLFTKGKILGTDLEWWNDQVQSYRFVGDCDGARIVFFQDTFSEGNAAEGRGLSDNSPDLKKWGISSFRAFFPPSPPDLEPGFAGGHVGDFQDVPAVAMGLDGATYFIGADGHLYKLGYGRLSTDTATSLAVGPDGAIYFIGRDDGHLLHKVGYGHLDTSTARDLAVRGDGTRGASRAVVDTMVFIYYLEDHADYGALADALSYRGRRPAVRLAPSSPR